MANKTIATDIDPANFLNTLDNEAVRTDCQTLINLMADATGEPPKVWGKNMLGFGYYHYRYESGREGDWFLTGFSPRKQNITIYLQAGIDSNDPDMAKLGNYKAGNSCLYIKKLSDIDLAALKILVERSVQYIKAKYAIPD
jgi:Domain of unknown function (DU1801)